MMTKIILLSLSGHLFSSSVEQVRHILAGSDIFPLVCLRRGISGVFLYQDDPIPILKPNELPGLGDFKGTIGGDYLIVLQSEYGAVGLPVDAAMTIVDAEDGVFENVSPMEEDFSDEQMFCYKDVRYRMLDMGAILTHLTD